MSNPGLIARRQHALDEYEAGRLSPGQVERALEFHLRGVEGVGLSAVNRSRDQVSSNHCLGKRITMSVPRSAPERASPGT
jgi:hypothetical protein